MTDNNFFKCDFSTLSTEYCITLGSVLNVDVLHEVNVALDAVGKKTIDERIADLDGVHYEENDCNSLCFTIIKEFDTSKTHHTIRDLLHDAYDTLVVVDGEAVEITLEDNIEIVGDVVGTLTSYAAKNELQFSLINTKQGTLEVERKGYFGRDKLNYQTNRDGKLRIYKTI
ncbi:hypothetical protein [Photobacterium damselae]|uniref:hypothetical protein n=1 Tax=Photobacterium damselae TaxID=38293 RepID=UPI004068898D